MPATIRGADSILEYPLTEHPDFHNLPGLTSQIVQGTIEFISDIENFLASHTGM